MRRRQQRRSQPTGAKEHLAEQHNATEQTPKLVCPDGIIYTVQPGDTWLGIAELFQTTCDALHAANPLVNPVNPPTYEIICVPGSLTRPNQHTGRRCLVLSRTLGAPQVEGVAYLNYITNVVLFIAAGLSVPYTIQPGAQIWIMWLRRRNSSMYWRYPLAAGRNGLYGVRAQVNEPLQDIDDIIISAEDDTAQSPSGRRVLVGDLDRSCGPF